MAGDNLMRLLENLKLEELQEVLAEGFCQHCNTLLENRITKLVQRNINGISLNTENSNTTDQKILDSPRIMPHQNGSNSSRSVSTLKTVPSALENGLSEEEKRILKSEVKSKKDFVHMERVNGKPINVIQGLELYTNVFNKEEQNEIVQYVYDLQRKGQKELLKARTYSEPTKWMRGKGRVTIQFGCCYNYAEDRKGNPPGILRDEEVDPLPPRFKEMIKRLVRWSILPRTCVPNSCIVNIYDEGDCIPPHSDHHDFLRPFCTVSFLTESSILFGSNLKIMGPGEFSGSVSIPLPVGSVLVLNGNGADVAKHCVPSVPGKRISITFRKMDDSKLPIKFSLDPDLCFDSPARTPSLPKQLHQNQNHHSPWSRNGSAIGERSSNKLIPFEKDEFPPLSSSISPNVKLGSSSKQM